MARLTQVVPAILTDDPEALERMVRQAESFTSYVQFDVMDGQFVPSRSINHEHLAALRMKLSWEAHLMVLNPEQSLEDFRQAGAEKVVFHYESTSAPHEVISRAKELGIRVGLAVNPETSLSAVLPLAGQVESVLFLTVDPGFYGSQFIPEVISKVVEFRSVQPEMEIGVDGGIKESNIGQVVHAGVDVIYVGSGIFLQPQPAESFRRLVMLAGEVPG